MWFQHDVVNGGFKGLPKRTAFDTVLTDKEFNIAKNTELHRYQRGVATMFFTILIKILLLSKE